MAAFSVVYPPRGAVGTRGWLPTRVPWGQPGWGQAAPAGSPQAVSAQPGPCSHCLSLLADAPRHGTQRRAVLNSMPLLTEHHQPRVAAPPFSLLQSRGRGCLHGCCFHGFPTLGSFYIKKDNGLICCSLQSWYLLCLFSGDLKAFSLSPSSLCCYQMFVFSMFS